MALALADNWESLQTALEGYAQAGERVALVPTMGALHHGHLSLVELAKARAERVVVSVFVNPMQFAPGEDFERYPRMLEKDKILLAHAGADLVYVPGNGDMYALGTTTRISAGPLAEQLCGAFRPGHFDGVCTVVAKLFNRVLPDVAIFGEKDFQQLVILRKMAQELDFMVEVIGAPIMREADGLAMSSRNAYLDEDQRGQAARLYAVLTETSLALKSGVPANEALLRARETLLAWGFTSVDYVALCDAETLATLESLQPQARLLAAAWLGKTRLIDNIAVE